MTAPGDAPDYPQLLRLDGRGYVVLGVGAGIGGQVALALSQAGGRVLCADMNPEAAEAAAKVCGGVSVVVDVRKDEDLKALVERARSEFGDRFAGVVDVIGVPVVGPLAGQDGESLTTQIDLVLRHAVRVTQLAGPVLGQNGGGSIVLIGSLAGTRSTASLALYGAAKAALNSFAGTAALELGPLGVRVNVVSPGRILSSGTVKPSADSIARITEAVPLRRLGQPRDIAGTVLFLISDLSAYISAAVIPVDGGIGQASALPN